MAKILDPARRHWEKTDWEEWTSDNEEYNSKFREALKNHEWFIVDELLTLAMNCPNYYQYPYIDDLLSNISNGFQVYIALYKKYFYEASS